MIRWNRNGSKTRQHYMLALGQFMQWTVVHSSGVVAVQQMLAQMGCGA